MGASSVIPIMSHQSRLSLKLCLQPHFISQTSFASSHFSNRPLASTHTSHVIPTCNCMYFFPLFSMVFFYEFISTVLTRLADDYFFSFHIFKPYLIRIRSKTCMCLLVLCQTQKSGPLLIPFVFSSIVFELNLPSCHLCSIHVCFFML